MQQMGAAKMGTIRGFATTLARGFVRHWDCLQMDLQVVHLPIRDSECRPRLIREQRDGDAYQVRNRLSRWKKGGEGAPKQATPTTIAYGWVFSRS